MRHSQNVLLYFRPFFTIGNIIKTLLRGANALPNVPQPLPQFKAHRGTTVTLHVKCIDHRISLEQQHQSLEWY